MSMVSHEGNGEPNIRVIKPGISYFQALTIVFTCVWPEVYQITPLIWRPQVKAIPAIYAYRTVRFNLSLSD